MSARRICSQCAVILGHSVICALCVSETQRLNKLANQLVKSGSVNFSIDGNMMCCTRPNFINLQESIAGFGASNHEAAVDLLVNERDAP